MTNNNFKLNTRKIASYMQQNLIPLTLEQHQQVLYEILYMVDDFCKAHDIPYFLVGGTLLGAVRHKGIIPWDDDVDIAMTRENYERFIKEFRANPTRGYSVLDFEHCPLYQYPFAKVVKEDTFLKERNYSYVQNIFIDIFVYDGLCNDYKESCERFVNLHKMVREAFLYYKGNPNYVFDSWKSKIIYYMKVFPKKYIPNYVQNYLSRLMKEVKSHSVYDNKYAACIVWGIYGKGEVQPSESFISLSTMQFGNRLLPIPSRWHDYLTGIYGDYMQLPSEDKRMSHSRGKVFAI